MFYNALAKTLALLAVAVIIALTIPQAKSQEAPLVLPADIVHIHDSPGGVVIDFLEARDQFLASGAKVQISGYCASACTLFLSLPNVCVFETTKLGFHAPYIPILEGVRVFWDDLTLMLLAEYPEPIQQWITANGGLGRDLIWLEGGEMLDLVPLCDGEPPVA